MRNLIRAMIACGARWMLSLLQTLKRPRVSCASVTHIICFFLIRSPPSLPLCLAEHHPKLAFSLLDGQFDETERFVISLGLAASRVLASCKHLCTPSLCSATSFADALKAWRAGEEVDVAAHTQLLHQQEHIEPQLVSNSMCVALAEPQPSTIRSIVCYNCCKKFVGENTLSCIQVLSKHFCTYVCSDAHWSKNKIRCPSPACSRRFFLLKDGIIHNGAAFCCRDCADNAQLQQ
jgi:hypothetical protein